MPKRVFWPAALVTMGLVLLASNLGMLPREFWNLWPLMLIVVGLGGLLTSDRDEWMTGAKSSARASRPAAKATAKKAAAKSKAKSRKR